MLLANCSCYCPHKPGPIAEDTTALPSMHGKKTSQRAACESLWVFREDVLASSLSENHAGQDLRLRECARGVLAGDLLAFISALAAF